MKYFVIHTLVFLLFLITYYLYIETVFEYKNVDISTKVDLFEYKDVDNSTMVDQFEYMDVDNSTKVDQDLIPQFLGDYQGLCIVNEILFLLMTALLFLLECLQFYKLKWNYWKQSENKRQLFIIGTAILAMCLKPYTLENNRRGEFVRGGIAFGFGISCFEFIFLTGKYPFRGGDFSIMFSRVFHKLQRYVIAMFMIVGGFSCSLNVITYGQADSFNFNTPFKSFVLTLTMAMGEFNAGELYQQYAEMINNKKRINEDIAEHIKIGRTLAMVILVFMILAGTITMVNLFVAVIISDKEKMEDEVFKLKLFYMAEGSELIKNLHTKKQSGLKVDQEIVFCVHRICGKGCNSVRVSESNTRIVPRLIELAEKNRSKSLENIKRVSIIGTGVTSLD